MINIPSNVLTFAGSDTTVYKQFVDYYRHYQSLNGGKKREFQERNLKGELITFSEKEDLMNKALKAEVARLSGVSFDPAIPVEQWASHPSVSWASMAVVSALVDMILPDALIDSIGLYTDIRNGGFGDSFSFDVKARDLFVVSQGGHSQKSSEIHKQFDTTVTVVPVPHQLTVQVALYKVLAGKESLASFTSKAVKSIEAQMARDAYTAFAAAMAGLSLVGAAPYSWTKVAGFTQDSMIALAQRVQAWNGGLKPVLAGTARALRYVLPDNGNYRYDIESELVKVGYVRTISGFDTMILDQFAAWETPFTTVLSDSNVYVISPGANKLLKLCIEGSTLSNVTQPFDNSNLSQNATFIKMWNVAVATNSLAGLITLS